VAIDVFRANNIIHTTPIGSNIIDNNIDFVRFDNDLTEETDEMIQSITLERIFKSDAVFVVAPKGYVGRTTCYEIGRILQKKLPLYFSSHPIDLPIKIPSSHIVNAKELSVLLLRNKVSWPFAKLECEYMNTENNLLKL